MTRELPTHKDLALAADVTVTTIKSYRRKFPGFFPVAGRGKPIRFAPQAVQAALAVRRHFRSGLGVEDTWAKLAEEFGLPQVVTAAGSAVPDASADADQTLSQPTDKTAAQTENTAAASLYGHEALRAPEPLARIEALMDGLFSLQNRTHSLLAELVAKLDTLADRMGAGPAESARQGLVRSRTAQEQSVAGPSPGLEGLVSTDRTHGSELPPAEDRRPPAELLALPVVVQPPGGDYLGVTSRAGRPFSLDQFEVYLRRRAEGMGNMAASWSRRKEHWVLSLTGSGQAHDHFFRPARTPRGNDVALFARLVIGGKTVSEAFLQTFLRQVKETLDA